MEEIYIIHTAENFKKMEEAFGKCSSTDEEKVRDNLGYYTFNISNKTWTLSPMQGGFFPLWINIDEVLTKYK